MLSFPFVLACLCINDSIFRGSDAAKVVEYSLSGEISDGQINQRDIGTRQSKTRLIDQDLLNSKAKDLYFASVRVGSPPQDITLLLATTSQVSFLIDKAGSCGGGRVPTKSIDCVTPFDGNASTTLKKISGKDLSLKYDKTGHTKGSIIQESIELGGTPISLELGLANDLKGYTEAVGRMSLGLLVNPNNVSSSESLTLLDQLVTNKLIYSRFYSVWLNSIYSKQGSLLLGGVDTEKFLGPLIEIPVVTNEPSGYCSSMVRLKALTISLEGKSPEIEFAPINVALDTAPSAIWLPSKTVYSIYKVLGARVRDGFAYLECNKDTSSKDYVSFGFENNATIKVPYSEFFVVAPTTEKYIAIGKALELEKTCVLGIFPKPNETDISKLGLNFMRSAYVAFDIDNAKIGIAQTNINATKSNHIEVKAGVSNFPKATGVVDSTISTTSIPPSNQDKTKTNPSTNPSPAQEGMPTGAKAGIGIGAAAVVLAVVGLLVFMVKRRKRRREESKARAAGTLELGTDVKPEIDSRPIERTELETEEKHELAVKSTERVELETETRAELEVLSRNQHWRTATELDAGFVSSASPDVRKGAVI